MSIEQTGVLERAARFAALGDPTRLAIVDLLALRDLAPGELQTRLRIPSNLLGHHLRVLERANVVARSPSEGDHRRTYLRLLPGARGFAVAGVALEATGLVRQRSLGLVRQRSLRESKRIVFVCSGNAARSPIAAAIWNASDAVPVPAVSAGTHPAPGPAPFAVAAAARHGLDIHAHEPVQLSNLRRPQDTVVVLCDRAYEELADPSVLHWSTANPATTGDEAAYERAFSAIDERVAALVSIVDRSITE
ncbi:arsenate reductase/protein-tyrosine-phosphatase family protein [Curtobacterium ammoniigenes]|uniref:arsenate reductase/protein-tyrosine-phosphatase family protein n=1 Tax=Curtobacterium ammoniigenes TaxID=395387 RepID=UPI00082B2AD4|nr:helix-turn-helix domain-containing protein [Curtobacterium ammoniigenes]